MTKRIENSPTAKMRIREYISDNGLGVKEVETACGYSNGFLSAGGEIGSDRLAKFVQRYPDADLQYIVTGVRSREYAPVAKEQKIRVLVELELTIDEFVRLGLRDKVIQTVCK